MNGFPSGADEADRRAARRAFIRSAHPDLGGDPNDFARGLAAYDATPVTPERARVYRSRRPDRVVGRLVRTLRRRSGGLPPRNLR